MISVHSLIQPYEGAGEDMVYNSKNELYHDIMKDYEENQSQSFIYTYIKDHFDCALVIKFTQIY